MGKFLVTYFSKTGSTQEIAERIGQNLLRKGIETDVKKMADVTGLENYSNVILGTPIYAMKMSPDFMSFITKNAEDLKNKVLAVFPVAYSYYDGRKIWQRIVDKSVEKIEKTLNPAQSTKIFAGRVPERSSGIMCFVFGIKKETPLDLVDLKEVDQWCDELF